MKHRDIAALIRKQIERNRAQFVSRLQRATTRDDSGCLLWIKARNNAGYGYLSFRHEGQHGHVYAHRLFYVLANQKNIPSHLVIDHRCGVRHCCNPEHLRAVTPKTNARFRK